MERAVWSRPWFQGLIVVVLSILGLFERAVGWLSGATIGDASAAAQNVHQWYDSLPLLGSPEFQTNCAVLAGLGFLWGIGTVAYHAVLHGYRRLRPPATHAERQRPARNVPEKRAAQAEWKHRVTGLCEMLVGTPGEPAPIDYKNLRLEWKQAVLDSFRDFLVPASAKVLTDEFLERTTGIERAGRAGKDAADRGLLYLQAKRGTMTDADLK